MIQAGAADVGPETGLEMRLQQRSRDHLEGLRQVDTPGAGPREGQKGQNIRSVGGEHRAESSESTEKRVNSGSLQGRLHRMLNSVAARPDHQ